MNVKSLKNGLKCIFHNMQNTHSVSISLNIKAGVLYGEPVNGIAHLLEHMHFRHIANTSQQELYYRMESIGSTLCGKTYRDMISFSMKVVPMYVNESINIFRDLIIAKDWTEEDLEKEKQVVINQILEKGDYVSVAKEVENSVFKGHNLTNAIMGTVESVQSIELDQIRSYKEKTFVTENMLLCITGNIDDSTREYIETVLGEINLTAGNSSISVIPSKFHKRKPDVVFTNFTDDAPIDVALAFDITYLSKDVDYITLLNCVLGEGVGSRLQRCIREDKGFSSNIYSGITWFSGFALLYVEFSVNKRNFYPCLKDVVSVINEIKKELTDKDLDVTIPFYTTNLMFNEDDTEEMNFQIAYNNLVFDRDYVTNRSFDREEIAIQIKSMARKIFSSKNCTVAAVGNLRGTTKKEIRNIIMELDKTCISLKWIDNHLLQC